MALGGKVGTGHSSDWMILEVFSSFSSMNIQGTSPGCSLFQQKSHGQLSLARCRQRDLRGPHLQGCRNAIFLGNKVKLLKVIEAEGLEVETFDIIFHPPDPLPWNFLQPQEWPGGKSCLLNRAHRKIHL